MSGDATAAEPVANKTLLTAAIMLAAIMQTLDSTIANVALPHIQAALSATQDEAAWVLTSYIVAAAVMFPLTGWLANAYGRRRVFLVSCTGFIVASMLCGAAASLPQLVAFRLLQGICGAGLVPLSQATLFEINETKDYGRAMAVFGVGSMLGPIVGPTLGGFLTDHYSWRWVFYINLPIGLLALSGLYFTLPRGRPSVLRFDFFGFASLSLAIAGLQLMLDRGQLLDWFSSREIITEGVVAGLCFYLFVVHTLSTDKPFINPALFRDRNFALANLLLFLMGMMMMSAMALHPLLLQGRMQYPAELSGLVVAPRGLGILVSMFTVGRLVPRLDARLVMASGFAVIAFSLWQMTQYSLLMAPATVAMASFTNGVGLGAVNVALSTVAFVTLPRALRNEGTAMFNLIRSTGGALGISIMVFLLTQNTARVHSGLSEHITPYNITANPALTASHIEAHSMSGLAMLNRLITDQSAMVAYIDDFRVLMIISLLVLPILLLFRRST